MIIPVFAYLVAIIGAMIGGAGALVAYLISSGMNYPQLKSWAKTEFREFLKTVLIIALAMFLILNLIHGIVGIMTGLSSSSIDDPMYFNTAKSFLYGQYIDTMVTVKDLMYMQAAIAGYSETSIELGLIVQLGVKPAKSLALPASTIDTAVQGGIIASVAFLILKALLDFAQNVAFTIIFPMGIIMRAFPMTRKMGTTLIAFSIVMFFVLPTAVIFNMWMYENFNWADVQYKNEVAPQYAVNGNEVLELYQTTVMESCAEFSDKSSYEQFWDRLDDVKTSVFNNMRTWVESNVPGFIGDLLSGTIKVFDIVVSAIMDNPMFNLKWIIGPVQDGFGLLYSAYTGGISLIANMFFSTTTGTDNINLREFIAASFSYSVDAVSLSANKLMFSLLCLFLDWVLVMSAFVSISGALGGETSVFGIDKLKIW